MQRQLFAAQTVVGQVDDKAGLTEALLQVLAGLGLVFDDQQFHCGSVRQQTLVGVVIPVAPAGAAKLTTL